MVRTVEVEMRNLKPPLQSIEDGLRPVQQSGAVSGEPATLQFVVPQQRSGEAPQQSRLLHEILPKKGFDSADPLSDLIVDSAFLHPVDAAGEDAQQGEDHQDDGTQNGQPDFFEVGLLCIGASFSTYHHRRLPQLAGKLGHTHTIGTSGPRASSAKQPAGSCRETRFPAEARWPGSRAHDIGRKPTLVILIGRFILESRASRSRHWASQSPRPGWSPAATDRKHCPPLERQGLCPTPLAQRAKSHGHRKKKGCGLMNRSPAQCRKDLLLNRPRSGAWCLA